MSSSYSEDVDIGQPDLVLSTNILERRNPEKLLFEDGLQIKGVIIKYEFMVNLMFTNIYIPKQMLQFYAEALQMRMPTSKDIITPYSLVDEIKKLFKRPYRRSKYPLLLEYFTEREHLYNPLSPDYFNSLARTFVASYIIDRHKIKLANGDEIGIIELLYKKVYISVFPLHDGLPNDKKSIRHRLFNEWGKSKNMFRPQPLDSIKNYFGYDVGMFFVQSDFYAYMLGVSNIYVIIFAFIYAVRFLQYSLKTVDDVLYTCPNCRDCKFHSVIKYTALLPIVHVVSALLVFIVIITIWWSIYLQLWKRHSISYQHRWGMLSLPSLPSKKRMAHILTFGSSGKIPFWGFRLPMTLIGQLSVLLGMACVICSVIIVNILNNYLFQYLPERYSLYILLNVIKTIPYFFMVVALEQTFRPIFVWTTEKEILPTESSHNKNLYFKLVVFQIFNRYSFIFFSSFIKPNLTGTPTLHPTVFKALGDECLIDGCLTESAIQAWIFAILMSMYEYVTLRIGTRIKVEKKKKLFQHIGILNTHTESHNLLDWDIGVIYDLYLALAMQYSFVVFLVSIVPFYPIFALLRHLLDRRLYALEFLSYYKRPMPLFGIDLRFWSYTTYIITFLAIIINAFIISYTLPASPKIVHWYIFETPTINNYISFLVSEYPIRLLYNGIIPDHAPPNITSCYYRGYRYPAGHQAELEISVQHWVIIATRLAIAFAYIVALRFATEFINYAIPAVSSSVREKMAEEDHLIAECVRTEALAKRAANGCQESERRLKKLKVLKTYAISSTTLIKREEHSSDFDD